MPTNHPNSNIGISYNLGQQWDVTDNADRRTIGDLLRKPVDFIQSTQPSGGNLFNGVCWANPTNSTYNVYMSGSTTESGWRAYSAEGYILVGRGALYGKVYMATGGYFKLIYDEQFYGITSFLNNYSGDSGVGYFKHGNIVFIQGLLTFGVGSSGLAAFNLPLGFRPTHLCRVPATGTQSDFVQGRVIIDTNGNIVCQTPGSTMQNIYLNGISFHAL